MALTSSHETSVDFSGLSSFIHTINQRNYGISIFSTPDDCLPICIRMNQQLRRPSADNSHQNLGKTILGLTFQAVLALFISTPNSASPLLVHLFAAAVLISFAVSFAGIFLQNSFPNLARLFEKIGALIAAIGVCIISGLLLVHQNFAWICWLASFLCLIVFVLSFK